MLTTQFVHIWHANYTKYQHIHWNDILSQDEVQRAGQFRMVQHRKRFVVTRGLLRILLAKYARKRPGAILFQYSQEGKPSLNFPPYFNLSHSNDQIIYGLTTISPRIGIDIESIDHTIDMTSIMRYYFSEKEIEAWTALPDQTTQRNAFFRGWTRKEAFLKAIGTGLGFPTQQIEVPMQANEEVFLSLPSPYNTQGWHLYNLSVPEGYMSSLAIDYPITQIEYFDCDSLELP